MVVATPTTITIDEFMQKHGGELNVDVVDLVRGRVVKHPMAGARNGQINSVAGSTVHQFVRSRKLGRVMSNDTHIRIAADTARGADVCFLSYSKYPADRKLTEGVLEIPPELVIEVRSPTDRWADALAKMLDYIYAGVAVVVILDPKTESATVFRPGDRQQIEKDQTLPDVLPGFSVPVAQFFEE